jgi:hypothetical protein
MRTMVQQELDHIPSGSEPQNMVRMIYWTPELGDVRLPNLVLKNAARQLTGRVLNPKGEPVAGARVSIHDFGRVETTTDADGRLPLSCHPLPDTSTGRSQCLFAIHLGELQRLALVVAGLGCH